MKNFEDYWLEFCKLNKHIPQVQLNLMKAVYSEGFMSGQQFVVEHLFLKNFSPKPSLN